MNQNKTTEERRRYWRDVLADRILAPLTPAEESDVVCRYWAYRRIPADRIHAVPTPEEEPDVDCRRIAYERIPADRIRIPTPEEEPDAECRLWAYQRIRGPEQEDGVMSERENLLGTLVVELTDALVAELTDQDLWAVRKRLFARGDDTEERWRSKMLACEAIRCVTSRRCADCDSDAQIIPHFGHPLCKGNHRQGGRKSIAAGGDLAHCDCEVCF